jgi:quinol monooxygenase YgiN
MRTRFSPLLGAIALAATALSAHAEEPVLAGQLASFIPMQAADGQADTFAAYFESAAGIVRESEPGTTYWFGLRSGNTIGIFDVFTDEASRQAHFEGQVAADIAANAGTWVKGGWDDGVVPNVRNAIILSSRQPVGMESATTATHITLRAVPGQGQALADLLTAGGAIIEDTEPGTLFWVALQYDDETFGIFDVFAGEDGRTAHFAGQVAALLNEQAPALVEGGWKNGVVANVVNFDILAMK